jgi:hypothetical protein
MDNVHTAEECGLRNGILYACLLTIVGLMTYAGHVWRASWSNAGVIQHSSFPITLFLVGYLVSIWLILPLLFRRSAVAQWKGYQLAIQQLMDEYSLTRLAAINVVADWKSGTLDAGSTSVISGAALLSTSQPAKHCSSNNADHQTSTA